MDWSLVLVSQNIETTILPPEHNGKWSLVVPSRDCERALKSLRQYQIENRDWPWRQELRWPDIHFDWVSLGWAAFLVTLHWLGGMHPKLFNSGIMDSAKVAIGHWWLVFTAMTLHADLGHLATNLSIGVVLVGLAMGLYGTGIGLLAAYVAGAAGNVVSLFLNAKPFHGLGASGMIMGALGLLAAQSLQPEVRSRRSWKYVVAGVMMFILYGLTPGTDIAAHLGGFVAGLLLGTILMHVPSGFLRSPRFNLASGIALLGWIAWTWRLALTHQ